MSPFTRIAISLALAVLGGVPDSSLLAGEFAFHHENVMGTSLELQVQAVDEPAARRAEAVVLRRIDQLSAIFSGYDASSELRRWQSGPRGSVRVSSELFEVLQASDTWRERTGGAFDPRVAVFSRLWSEAARNGRVPTSAERTKAAIRMSSPAWRLDPSARTAERLSDAPIALDGIAKGDIVEKACDAAMAEVPGLKGIMLNVGGDLRVRGEINGTIGIAAPWADSEASEPLAFIAVKDRSVSTSGNSQRGFQIGGRWYSHIIDPRTGRPVERVASATVIAEHAIDADAFATACNVLEPDECLRIARSHPGVEFLIVEPNGRTIRSDGWHRYERPAPAWLASAVGPGDDEKTPKTKVEAPWNPDYELVVNFEINRPDTSGGRYRRPYVVIWVEDEDGKLVRTMSLWVSMGGSGPFQWMPDLKRWYTADADRQKRDKKDLFFTMARPTRPPGKYRVIWNGKDNHKKPLPAGEYTIWIEAAREHGTYQAIHKKVTIGDKPFAEELKGNVEIRAASIEYRRKSAPKSSRGR